MVRPTIAPGVGGREAGRENRWQNISCLAVDQSELGPHRVRIGTTPQRVYAAEKYFPVLVFGPQRSGKTSGFAVPALIDWGGPAVVTSVRRDILDDTYQWRQSPRQCVHIRPVQFTHQDPLQRVPAQLGHSRPLPLLG